jgi:flagellum-specific peptidoglycan hydrolase FlgJ
MFGMKQATQRPTTNKGSENGYAYYNSWHDCLVDYAMYQSKIISKITTEDEYFQYLGQTYAQDPKYVDKLKEIIEREK